MTGPESLQIRTPRLGGGRGLLSDWVTQRWVQMTGVPARWDEHPWLQAPVGDVDVIGADFFHRWAGRQGFGIAADESPRGLVDDFTALVGPDCDPREVDPEIAGFYERTSGFDFDVWSQWCGAFKPFGILLAAIFSRRLQQLNVPLSPLETKLGIESHVFKITAPDNAPRLTAWVRETVASGKTLYAGSYSTGRVPGFAGSCVKVAFPLPNGYALVVMRPESHRDGSFTLYSDGKRFGDPGFYFYVESKPGQGWARYVSSFKESIHVYRDERSTVRAEHILRLWGLTFLRLHYRMLPRAGSSHEKISP